MVVSQVQEEKLDLLQLHFSMLVLGENLNSTSVKCI